MCIRVCLLNLHYLLLLCSTGVRCMPQCDIFSCHLLLPPPKKDYTSDFLSNISSTSVNCIKAFFSSFITWRTDNIFLWKLSYCLHLAILSRNFASPIFTDELLVLKLTWSSHSLCRRRLVKSVHIQSENPSQIILLCREVKSVS